jgi:hypothetical protein
VGLEIFSLPNFLFKSPKRNFVRYLEK